MLSINALVAAAELLIPVTPDPLATQVLDTIDRVRERLNPALRIAGILPVRVRPHTRLARQALADLAARFPDLLLPVHIRDTVRAAEAPARQLPLLDDRPDSAAAQDYRALATLLVDQEARA
jgi:chromosome partitioning protein